MQERAKTRTARAPIAHRKVPPVIIIIVTPTIGAIMTPAKSEKMIGYLASIPF